MAITHDESLENAVALAVPVSENEYHLVLLFPDGQGLEAVGSPSGITSRGTLLSPLGSKQLATAIQASNQRGSVLVSPPNPSGVPPPPEARYSGNVVIRDHRKSANPPPTDIELAYYHAPIHYQDTNSSRYIGDYITRFDYDGDWAGTNNWDNMSKRPLPAHVYYSVVETCTHWYIVYAFYHPQDWTNMVAQEHENDMEGELSIVRKDGSQFGKLEGMVMTFHEDFYSYTPAGSPLRDGPLLDTGYRDDSGQPIRTRQDIDGRLLMNLYDGTLHPLTNQADKGHGFRAFPHAGDFTRGANGGDGIIYYPSRTVAEVPASGNDRDVKYGLLDLFAPNGLWNHQLTDLLNVRVRDHREGALPPQQSAGPTFHKWGTVRGDESGSCGNGLAWCDPNADQAPWLWDDKGLKIGGVSLSSGDVGVYPGEIAMDPAHLTKSYFTGLGNFSEKYIRNRYLSDLRNTYQQSNLPWGWPGGLNLNSMYSKLKTSCP